MVVFAISNVRYELIEAIDGREATEKIADAKPHLILMDWMLPDVSGVELVRRIKRDEVTRDIPVIMLTAKTEERNKVEGLDSGADDYITKPIRPKLLIAKLKTMLRRRFRALEESTEELILGEMVIDFKKYHVLLNGKEEILPRKEFELLTLLAKNAGIVIRREEIMKRIWQSDVIVGGRTIDVHIRRLRERIGDDKIKTVKGVGYKLVVA
jgi:two-component system alkaline phosphatase synthesis response regulator PhoP